MKNKAAVSLGKLGGEARARRLSAARRREIAAMGGKASAEKNKRRSGQAKGKAQASGAEAEVSPTSKALRALLREAGNHAA